MEKYLSCAGVRAHKTALTKYRTSAHQLRIETGRYQNLEEKREPVNSALLMK